MARLVRACSALFSVGAAMRADGQGAPALQEAQHLSMQACINGTLPQSGDFGDPLTAYFVEFAASPNVPRLHCQLAPSFQPLVLEEAFKSTEEDFQRWQDEGLIAWDHILGGWDRNPVKYASIYMNHLNIWRKIAEAPQESEHWTGVFEGDAVFRKDFHEVVRDLRGQLADGRLPHADIVYMGHCMNNDCAALGGVGSLVGGVSVIKSEQPVCSHAYLLSRRGAQVLVDNALPIQANNDDVPMRSLIREGKLQALSLCPTIARQSDKEWMPSQLAPNWLYAYYIPLNYFVVVSVRTVVKHLQALSVFLLVAMAVRLLLPYAGFAEGQPSAATKRARLSKA